MNHQKGSNKGHNHVPGLPPSDQLAARAARLNELRPPGSKPVGIKELKPKRKKDHRGDGRGSSISWGW